MPTDEISIFHFDTLSLGKRGKDIFLFVVRLPPKKRTATAGSWPMKQLRGLANPRIEALEPFEAFLLHRVSREHWQKGCPKLGGASLPIKGGFGSIRR